MIKPTILSLVLLVTPLWAEESTPSAKEGHAWKYSRFSEEILSRDKDLFDLISNNFGVEESSLMSDQIIKNGATHLFNKVTFKAASRKRPNQKYSIIIHTSGLRLTQRLDWKSIKILNVELKPSGSDQQATSPYPAFAADLRLLRDHNIEAAGDLQIAVSSDEAISAARRIFSKVTFLYKTKKEVLQILGDPKTISSYGVSMKESSPDVLIYRFDSGFGGCDYQLKLTNNIVTSVTVIQKN